MAYGSSPIQALNPSYICDLYHNCGSAGSLTHYVTVGTPSQVSLNKIYLLYPKHFWGVGEKERDSLGITPFQKLRKNWI